MSVNVTVQIPAELQRDLAALGAAKREVTSSVVEQIAVLLQRHFEYLQARPRADGLKPVGFWAGTDSNSVAEKVGDAVLHDDGSATITIDSDPLRHKLDGGTVKPVGHPYLTIPATDAAAQADEGARSFTTHIEWVPHPDGGVRPALVLGGKMGKGEKKTGDTASEALFWLVRQVKHLPMPGALPDQAKLDDAARDAALDAIDVILSQSGEAA